MLQLKCCTPLLTGRYTRKVLAMGLRKVLSISQYESSLAELRNVKCHKIFSIQPDMLHNPVKCVLTLLQRVIPCSGGHVENVLLWTCKYLHAIKRNFLINSVIWMSKRPLLTKIVTICFLYKNKSPCMRIICLKPHWKPILSLRIIHSLLYFSRWNFLYIKIKCHYDKNNH